MLANSLKAMQTAQRTTCVMQQSAVLLYPVLPPYSLSLNTRGEDNAVVMEQGAAS